MTIGFIGLGNMGRPMATNLARKGARLIGYDVRAEPVQALNALGATAGESVGHVAAQSDVVFTMLPTTAVVADVFERHEGLLAAARVGTTIVEMSTIDPLVTDRLAASAHSRGLHFADAPVGRLASHAERGESLFMVGASDTTLAQVMPLLEKMGTTIHHCGPPGAGIRTKLVNNYIVTVLCQLNAEALALSQKFGLNLETTLSVVHGTTATNGQLKVNWANKVLAGDTAPGFAIDLAHKDLTLIVDAANALQVPVPVAAAAREAYSAARSRGYGAQDFSAMADAWCDGAGIPRARTR